MALEETRIGDFSKNLVERPPSEAPKVKLDTIEKKLDVEAQEAERTLKPRQTYEERLREIGVTKDEAADIIDAVLMKGVFTEECSITPRVKLRLRTRQYRDTLRVQTHLEVARYVYESHVNETINRYNLAASLEKLGKDVFEHPDKNTTKEQIEQMFQMRLDYVEGLPDPTRGLLFNKLWRFDQKIMIVLEEGAIENF